jgi:hypothetical protein
LYCLKRLTKNTYKVFVLDNGSKPKDFQKLKRIVKEYDNVFLERKESKLKGSIAHGIALNYLVSKVDTPYLSILDADAAWLIKDWDEILIGLLNDKIKVIGTQAPVGSQKPSDFPLMFASLFETETFKKLHIDFRPKSIPQHQDTGWKIREKYLKAGYKGKILEMRSTRIYKEGPFKDIICVEYYLKGISHIFASHFGRGSTLGEHKYRVGTSLLYRLPKVGKLFRQLRGKKEKEKWIEICKKIADE